MDTYNTVQRPEPCLAAQPSFNSQKPLVDDTTSHLGEYDPCSNAQKFSPFYQYNHDSPRPSQDLRPKQSFNVSVKDLELGAITPSVSQEKIQAHRKSRIDLDRLKFWQGRRQHCLTKPKKQRWIHRLPKKQRIMVKLAIAFLVAGVMIGIAVGIAAALHSGVYGTDKVVGKPGES